MPYQPKSSIRNEVEQKLIEIFRVSLLLEMNDEEICLVNRANNPKWDSMTHLNLVLASEEAFQISIPDEQGAAITSFASMLAVVRRLI